MEKCEKVKRQIILFLFLTLFAGVALGTSCGAAEVDEAAVGKARVVIFERQAPTSAKTTTAVMTFGISNIKNKARLTITSLDGAGRHLEVTGFSWDNFAEYYLVPGLYRFLLFWPLKYDDFYTHKNRGFTTKEIEFEGGKTYYITWTPAGNYPVTGPLFSVVSEAGAKRQLHERSCFDTSANEKIVKKVEMGGGVSNDHRSFVRKTTKEPPKENTATVLGEASLTEIPRLIKEPRWDSAVGSVSLVEIKVQKWAVKSDVARGLIVFHNWVCKNKAGNTEFVCYGLDRERNDRFWILHTAYRGQKYAPRVHSQAKLYEVREDGMIRDLQSYETQRHWGGVHFPGNEGFVDLYSPSEKGAQWHAVPTDVREFLHEVVPEKY